MALGQAMFRDSRRRRVLQDEGRRAGEYVPVPATEGSRYTEAANVENHPQITQFIPRRYRTYALGLALATGGVGAIVSLHIWAGDLAGLIQSGPIAAFDLAAGGGLAAWFAALVLAGLAIVAWIVYSLRRHRVDDYRARYRLWMWVVGAALVASVDSVASLHQPWSSLCVSLIGWSALGGAVWWLVPVGLFGGWAAVRLASETAECRGALCLVLVSAAAYAIALLAALGIVPAGLERFDIVIISSALLEGHAFALAAAMLYARYLVLDVQGLIPHAADAVPEGRPSSSVPVGANRSARTLGTAQEGDGASPSTLPLDPQARREQGKSSPADPNGAESANQERGVAGSESHQDGDSQTSRKLSKAERKRLRKQGRQCA